MESQEERSAERAMDNYLTSIGLHRKKIAKDGSCLFRAVAEQVLHSQSQHMEVRARCVDFLKQNRDSYEAFIEGDFEEYLLKLQDPQQWVGEVEINALAVIYKRDFQIFQEPGKPAVNITDNNFQDKVRLCFLNGNHYDSVYPLSRIKNSGFCQSILYEMLYDGVFQVDRSVLAQCQRGGRPNNALSDDAMPACGSSDDNSEPDEPLWVENETSAASSRSGGQSFRGRGRGRRLPERVWRSLNPTLLRNVEYDIWHKSKRAQQKMDYSIAAGMQFSVGDRCQVRLENSGRSYSATVREIPPTNGPVTVYIEELGTKQVPLWNLRPPCVENSWSTVVHKRLNNGHGAWEDRGRGRGRGKSTLSPSPSSSSVPLATAAGSGGRVQKQHSWPPQATVEEQGGVKTSKKSASSVEPTSQQQHLAKEDDAKRNVALVEIQLRDEHSFPALGAQAAPADGARMRASERRRPQRNKTSFVDDVVSSPPAGDGPKSSASPVSSAPSTLKPPTYSSGRSSAEAAASGSSHSYPAFSAAPPTKATTQSYASAAAAPSSPPPSVKPSVPSSAGGFSFITPVLPAASAPPTSSSSPPPPAVASPPPSSSAPQPTFIAPIAPCPAAAQGFLRSFCPTSSLPRSPSPASSSVVPPPALPAPSVAPKTEGTLLESQTFQSGTRVSQIHPRVDPDLNQVSGSREENQTQPSLPETQSQNQDQTLCRQGSLLQNQDQNPLSRQGSLLQNQDQTQSHGSLLQNQDQNPLSRQGSSLQNQTQSHGSSLQNQDQTPLNRTEVLRAQTSVPQTQVPFEPQAQPRSDVVQFQSSAPPPDASQVPADVQTEAPPTQKPETPPPPPSGLPQFPGLPQPLHQLSQWFQDPLYPGFPQGEQGEVLQIPPFSACRTGDDLPKDVNLLRFFFNLGVKAYSLPVVSPCLYLLPLQQFYTMQANAHSPAPFYPSSPTARPPEAQPPTQYHPASASPQYDHHTPPAEPPHSTEPLHSTEPPHSTELPYPTEPPHPTEPRHPTEPLHPSEPPCPSEPLYAQPHYQGLAQPQRVPCPSIPWTPIHPSRNPSYQVGYASPPPPFPGPPPLSSQVYHPVQGPAHPMYPPAGPRYPPYSQGYQPSSTPEELHVSQGAMEQLQPTNGDSLVGHSHVRVLGPLEAPAAANVANANNSRNIVVTSNFGLKKEAGESLTRTVLLVDPPINNTPILAVVSDPDVGNASVSKATGSIPGSPSIYQCPRQPFNPAKQYVPPGAQDPSPLGYPATVAMAESLSVACSTEDDFEGEGFTVNVSGQRRSYRGRGGRGRGGYDSRRGGYDSGRGAPRRRYVDMGAGPSYVQFSPSYRGRGRERGY